MSIENNQNSSRKIRSEILQILLFLLGLFLVSLTGFYTNYLLFHSITEIFSIVIAGGVFLVGWNSRKYMKNSFFLIIGVSSLFIGVIDLMHTLSYAGMQIFEGFDANLPTSLWIAARYLQATSLLIASLLIKRSLNPYFLSIVYLGVSIILIIIIFANLFPVCYIDGTGLTPFKIIS